MEDLVRLERRVKEIYDDVFVPLARQTGFQLPVNHAEAPRLPTVLFLGNHSSGKSSFINYLTESQLQKTGLAPTDDGFTIITYGEKQEEADGQTAVTHPDLAFEPLRELGPAFLSRLKLKTYPNDLLKSVMLVDSPGMIDAAAKENTRGYDFAASVRAFAERADLILFFFDPDKPGTTGETINIFTDTLSGLTHKLMILMHKVDQFQSMRDFARTYGTLCWNLAKIIKSKDIPHIFNTFLPTNKSKADPSLPLDDFDSSREEVIGQIHRAPTRRGDNMVSDLYNIAFQLHIHLRVCRHAAARYRKMRSYGVLGLLVSLALGGGGAWYYWQKERIETSILPVGAGVLAAGLVFVITRFLLKRFKRRLATPEEMNRLFESAFNKELTLRERPDLRGWWDTVRQETMRCLRTKGPEKIPHGLRTLGSFKKLNKVIREDVPSLRRIIDAYHRKLRTMPEEK